MSKTYASLFRRPSLNSILDSIARTVARLDDFVTQAKSDLTALDVEADRIAAERAEIANDIGRATRAKDNIAGLIA